MAGEGNDKIIKCLIAVFSIFAVAVVMLNWYYEAAVILVYSGFCWFFARRTKIHRTLVVAVVAAVGIASTIEINRLVTHHVIVENSSGGKASIFLTGDLPLGQELHFGALNLRDGYRNACSFRSLFYDGNLLVQVDLPDGSYHEAHAEELKESYHGMNHVIVNKGGEIEILRH